MNSNYNPGDFPDLLSENYYEQFNQYVEKSRPDDSWTERKPPTIKLCELTDKAQGRLDILIDDITLPCWIGDVTKEKKKLYVSFIGHRPRASRTPMMRWSWDKYADGLLICVSDPTFAFYPNCLLGWYYGSNEKNGHAYIYKLVKKIQDIFSIKNNNTTFYGSSGGGVASICISRLFPGSSSVSINPQINFFGKENKERIDHFIECAGFSPNEEPSRVDCISTIKRCTQNRFVILQNSYPGEDYWHLHHLSKSINVHPELGINVFLPNLILWVYCTSNNGDPHKAMDQKPIFSLTDILCHDELSEIEKRKTEFINYTALWNEIYNYKEVAENNFIKTLIMCDEPNVSEYGMRISLKMQDPKTTLTGIKKICSYEQAINIQLLDSLFTKYTSTVHTFDVTLANAMMGSKNSEIKMKGIAYLKKYSNSTPMAGYLLSSQPAELSGIDKKSSEIYYRVALKSGITDALIPLIKLLMESNDPQLQKEAHDLCINEANPSATIAFFLYQMYSQNWAGGQILQDLEKSEQYLRLSVELHYWRAERTLIKKLIKNNDPKSLQEVISICNDICINNRRNAEYAKKILSSLENNS